MNYLTCILFFLAAFLALPPGAEAAQTETAAPVEAGVAAPARAGVKTMRVHLDKLNKYKAIDLKYIASGYRISFPVPERWDVRKARLFLKYTNSSGLREGSSHLVVRLNDIPLGQANLNPRQPDGELLLSIPAGRLLPGYQSLNFSVAQHYLDKCEQWDSPDLWTNLQFDSSYLEFEYGERPVPAKLPAALAFLFDPKVLPSGEVNIVTDNASSELVTLSGIAVSGLARRFDYQKVDFTASPGLKPGFDNVLVGLKDFVEGKLSENNVRYEITGSVLKVMPLPLKRGGSLQPASDPARGLLIIAGTTPEELRKAVLAAAELTFPFPGKDETFIKDVSLPKVTPYSGKDFVERGRANTLKTIGRQTINFRGIGSFLEEISFRVPNDYLIRQNKYVTLALNFVYSPGLKADSSLSVSVNGTVAQVINLDKAAGDMLEKYKLQLPAYLFRPGLNKILLSASLTPSGRECETLMPESYFLTVYDNSTLKFPEMSHLVELPKVELFVDNGFPFNRMPDGADLEIFLADPEYDELAAAFNMIGFASQKYGYPLFNLTIGLGELKPSDKELLVFSRFDTLPAALSALSPIELRSAPGESEVPRLTLKKWNKYPLFSSIRQFSALDSDSGILMGFQSPYHRGRSVLVFNAASAQKLRKLSQVVMDPAVNGNISGSLVAIDLKPESQNSVLSSSVGGTYWTGKNGRISYWAYLLNIHSRLFYGGLAVGILLLSIALYYVLAGYRRRRLALAHPEHQHKGGGVAGE